MNEIEKFASEMKCDIISISPEVYDYVAKNNQHIADHILRLGNKLPVNRAVLSDGELIVYVEIETNNEVQTSGKIVHLIGDRKIGYWFLWHDDEGVRVVPTVGNPQIIKNCLSEEAIGELVFLFLVSNQIMIEAPSAVDVKEKRTISEAKKSSKQAKTKKKRSRRVFVYRSYSISGRAADHLKPKKNIKCPEWSVRGHYRHYKSGKVVFIGQYTKGRNRGKNLFECKEYKLIEERKNEKNG